MGGSFLTSRGFSWGLLASDTSVRHPAAAKLGVFLFSLVGILYTLLMVAVAALVIYALVLAIIFLRLRIQELKRGQEPPLR